MSNFKYESLEQAIVAGDAEEFIKMHKAGVRFPDCPFGELSLSYINSHPNFEILKYLHETGTNLSDRCFIDGLCRSSEKNPEAALQCLRYAMENGADFYVHSVVNAYKSNKECFAFSMEQLGKLFAAREDKEKFWCPVLEEQFIVDAIDFEHPNWKPLLTITFDTTYWKDFWLEHRKAELTEWPLITAKIKEKLRQINCEKTDN